MGADAIRCEGLSRGTFSRGRALMRIDRRRFLRTMAILGVVFAYATIVLGGTVRGMGAGLACPDWPLCNGSLVPNVGDAGVLVEYVHRLVAVLTGLFVLFTLLAAILWFRSEMRLVTLSIVSFAVLATQIVVGAVTISSAHDSAIISIQHTLELEALASDVIVAMVSLWPPSAARAAALDR